jgi:hypothetical protein
MAFALSLMVSFPCSVIEPELRSRHLYTGYPPCQLQVCIHGSSRWVAAPLILGFNMVSYDASAVVYSHLIRLLSPHLTDCSLKKNPSAFSMTLSTVP